MHLTLSAELERLINERLQTGGYSSAEEVIRAGLASLQQIESFGDFSPGELDRLLAEGEASGAKSGTVPADVVFARLKQRGQDRRGNGA